MGIYDPWHVLFPAAISSRIKAALTNTIDLPHTKSLDDLRPFVTSERLGQIGGLGDIVDAWSKNGLMNAPECWCQQHTLFELVMTSMTSQYDAMSDRRGYVWRRLFTGPCSNSWLNLASHGPQIPQCDRPKHFQTLLKWRLSLPLCSDFLRPLHAQAVFSSLTSLAIISYVAIKWVYTLAIILFVTFFFRHSGKQASQPCQRFPFQEAR